VVYGPFAPVWTIDVVEQLSRGRVILVNGGEGSCNAIYIDDLISAMLLAAVKQGVAGEVFLISGEAPVTWKEFFCAYEQMLGVSSTVCMSSTEAENYWKRQNKGLLKELINVFREEPVIRQRIFRTRRGAALKNAVRSVIPSQVWGAMKKRVPTNGAVSNPSDPDRRFIIPLTPDAIQFYESKCRVSVDKAMRMLGFRPAFDLQRGMAMTENWLQWSNLINHAEMESQSLLR
jgi:nucleoside-diphosphate-sugar epimerase